MNQIGSFIRLTELIPPPDSPVRAYGDWKRFASVNGFPPPDDYRMLIREYGAGTFGDWLHLIESFNHSWTFMDRVEAVCDQLRRVRPAGAEGVALPIWPEPGGFLPWATTATGDVVGWRTEGRPASWTTVVLGRGDALGAYPVGAVDFVLGLVERSLGDAHFDDAQTSPFATRGRPAFAPSES